MFNINELITEEKLEDIDKKNIDKVFSKIFSPSNYEHQKILCYANNESILKEFKRSPSKFDLAQIAQKLAQSELKSDGSRNKQITEGFLFIKRSSNNLYLLKLENIEVVDIDKHYEMKPSFSTESNYYKGCILESDINNIIIIDKNRSVAKYWIKEFLNLSLIRDDYLNTKDLISLHRQNKLLSDSIVASETYNEIRKIVDDNVINNEIFDKNELVAQLKSKKLVEQIELVEIFSEDAKIIDSEFILSPKAIREEYKKTIEISKGTKIFTDNFSKLFERQKIKFENGNIVLKVDTEYISNIPKELLNGNNREF